MIYQLFILISLIDLDESATAVQIQANLENHRYLPHPLDPDIFAAALVDLLAAGHLSQSGKEMIEVEYSAYGLIQELSAKVPAASVTETGWSRLREIETYAAQIFVDEETWVQELAQEREKDHEREQQERLLEKENADIHGYPYDILLQARDTKRGRTHIYVVLLHDGVRRSRRVRSGINPARPAVYVGLTGLTPQQRFQNHKANHKAGRGYVRDHGLCLLPHLYQVYNPMPRKLAIQAEKALAEKLRLQGYTVLGGH
jgi:predicted GIY-YIG superfamily endonuclease